MRALRLLCLGLLLAVPAAARAETPKSAKHQKASLPPYRLVRILPETNQALLLDKKKGKHVLVDVGDTIGAYQVDEIDSDQVVLSRENDEREYVLVEGEATPTSRTADPYPMPDPVERTPKATGELLDPYPADVLDPYGTDGVRTVEAPDPVKGDDAAKPKADDPPKVDPPKVDPPKVAPPKADPPKVDPPPTSFTVVRKELNHELSDFAQVGKDLTMSLVDDGVAISAVAKGSFFDKMGLRAGDVVRKVDGTAIHGLDDAATVYARLGKLKKLTVEITRDGQPLTLRYTITK